jgi:TetR/AcrR family tetracycline transcriptional repressor
MAASKKRVRRVPRGSLSRDRIVDAALELVDRGGIEELSMPKLARHLGVGVMSLYSHVESKDDLLDALVQRVLEAVAPPTGGDWRESIRRHFGELRAALCDHPGIGAVLTHKNVAVPAVFDILEGNLAVLRAGGLTPDDTVTTYYTLLAFTLGFVSWELPRTHKIDQEEYARRWQVGIDQLDADEYPTLHELASTLPNAAAGRQFDRGLERLLGSHSWLPHLT